MPLFANQAAAHEALSDGLKQTLEGLRAANTSAKADASRTREDRIKDSGTTAKDHSATHPTVREPMGVVWSQSLRQPQAQSWDASTSPLQL